MPLVVRHALIAALPLLFPACEAAPFPPPPTADATTDSLAFIQTLQAHLDAVAKKDLTALRSTLMPGERMELILPGTPPTYTVKEFMDFHVTFFDGATWTFEPTIVSAYVGSDMGIAHTEVMYREPERDGKPYFNRMAVGYALEKVDGRWYVVKDQMCSLEKSTD